MQSVSPQRRHSPAAPTQCWPGSLHNSGFQDVISRRRLFEKAGPTYYGVFILLHSSVYAVSMVRAKNGREGIQVFLSRCDWPCLRETSKFQATCERFKLDDTCSVGLRATTCVALVHQPCGKGQVATTWMSPGWSRTANSQWPPIVPLLKLLHRVEPE